MKPSLTSYLTGFLLSVALTLAAFFVVVDPAFFHIGASAVIPAIIILAVLQLVVQLIFFMHLLSEMGSGWKLTAFIITLCIILIIVIGSIWIMNHLNYNMMASPTEMNQYINSQDGL